ncbi:MAG: ABC transporter substrate-binding protein [Lachnospirales bacterium]
MKKLISSLLVSVFLFTACGTGASNKGIKIENKTGVSKTQNTDNEVVELTYTGWGSPAEKKTTQNVINNFEANNPNIKVKFIHVATDYTTKLSTMISSGEGPDVAMLYGDLALQWAIQGQIKNVLEMAEGDESFSIDDFLPQTVYWWDKDKVAGINGALEVFGLMYNKDVLNEAGIDVPIKEEDAWTWEEFVEVAQKLTIDQKGRNALDPDFDAKNIKQFGLYIPGGATMVSYAMAYSKQGLLNDEGTKINLAGTKGAEAMQNFADLITKYHVAPSPVQAKSLPGGSIALSSKKVAMIWDGQWALMDLVANKVNFGVGIAPKMYDTPSTLCLGEPIVTFETTEHPNAAWKLQKAFMQTEYNMELIEGGLWMPTQKSYYEDEALVNQWATGNPAHPDGYIPAFLDNGFTNGKPVLLYSVKNFPRIMDVMSPALDKLYLGEMTAEEVISSTEENMNKEVQGFYSRPEQ